MIFLMQLVGIALSFTTALAQPDKPISICELLRNRQLYDKKLVVVRGGWVVSIHESTLQPADGFCDVPPDVKNAKVWLDREEGAPPRPVRPGVEEDYKSESISRRFWALWGWVAILTVTGTFEIPTPMSDSPPGYLHKASRASGILRYKTLGEPLWIKASEFDARMKIPDRTQARPEVRTPLRQ
jgi:hypothetical protein